MLELDATTRSRLVDLRRLLRDGQARAQDRTHSGQLLAIVLLDAACEHAVGLALAHRNASPGRNAEASLTQLENLEKGRWEARGRKGVIELRKQRNNAMHHGIGSKADDVGRWARDTEAFIGSTVAHVFEIEIADVAVADSVRDDEVRRLLRTAESAVDAEDYAEAKYWAVDAFEAARRLWTGQRPKPGVPWYDHREANLPEGVRVDLERLRDQAEVQPFATDFGEYLWLKDQHRKYQREAPVPVDDALRALSFATEWILRWEAHVARRIDREAEWRDQQEPPASGKPDAAPSVVSISVAPDADAARFDPAMVRITAQLQDLPAEQRETWRQLAGNGVSDRISGFGSRGVICDPAGRLSFLIPLGSEGTEVLVDRIIDGVAEATVRWREHCAIEREVAVEAAAILAACQEALQAWIGPSRRLRQIELVPGRRDVVRISYNKILDSNEAHWTRRLLEDGYGAGPGINRIDVGDNWADLPLPEPAIDASAILAEVMMKLDQADDRRARIQSELDHFALKLSTELSGRLGAANDPPPK
ncbi:MAG: hypothetical protein JWQ18_89 [Conexibacter sp.]|nr:hypothetical protein [Conexibacter sp.]